MTEQHDQQRWEESPRPGRFQKIVDAFIAGIPSRHVINLGKILGTVFYLLDVPHRKIVRRNLQFAYPDWPRERVNIFSKRIFQNVAITILEIFQMAYFSCDQIMAKVRISGEEHIQRALELNKGLILISAHLGNWEAGFQFFSCFFQMPITGVAKKIRFKPLHRWLNRLRIRFGIKIVDKKGALPDMRLALRRGEVIGLLIDQSKRSESVDVNFFGKTVTATPAAALLALRCKSPVIHGFCVREADGQLSLRLDPPLNLQRTGDLRADLIANTQMMTDVVERAIREHPAQWLWLHKRWKKHYPHLEQRRSSDYRQS
jgi:KDO2-lipid IV(A) lauroyltransferase